ncbi:hypothetical protein [Ruania rhizosphaerae]|uniref:hypothetical protein n=1 Tax=Ruania rhizosphaerae TaxID=1840413 RepID=UPI00135CD035|nr:hypothetical protein [Ruania rhizosphaerae]
MVTSELEAPWYERAGGTTGLKWLAVGLLVLAMAVTGQITALFNALAMALVPVVLVLLVAMALIRMLPGGRFFTGLALGGGLRAMRGHSQAPRTPPGRQLTVETRAGDTEEVLVASTRRLPAGSHIRVLGPRLMGRRHAWVIRPASEGTVLARGVLSTAILVPVILVLTLATFASGVAG